MYHWSIATTIPLKRVFAMWDKFAKPEAVFDCGRPRESGDGTHELLRLRLRTTKRLPTHKLRADPSILYAHFQRHMLCRSIRGCSFIDGLEIHACFAYNKACAGTPVGGGSAR